MIDEQPTPLQRANKAEAERLKILKEEGEKRIDDVRKRERIKHQGLKDLQLISERLQNEIIKQAPTTCVQSLSSSGHRTSEDLGAWVIRLNRSKLVFSELFKAMRGDWKNPNLPSEVLYYSSVEVSNDVTHSQGGFQGRSHSLWFCNAEDRESFQWYEIAFRMEGGGGDITPFAMPPDKDSDFAIRPGMHSFIKAMDFLPLDREESIEKFVSRWGDWFGYAANGELHELHKFPES